MSGPPLGKELASNDKKTRDKAVSSLRHYLVSNAQKMDSLEMAKLWKGIFYCFWMSDKPLVQQELSQSLANLLLDIPTTERSFDFLRGFWEAMIREWSGLDYLRIDKYYMLVRRFINVSFKLLIREHWSLSVMKQFDDIMSGKNGPLYPEDPKAPTSLSYHVVDVYNEELDKAMKLSDQTTPAPLIPLYSPFFTYNALNASQITHNRLFNECITPLLNALLEQANCDADPSPSHRFRTPVSQDEEEDGGSKRRKKLRVSTKEPEFSGLIKNACLEPTAKGTKEEVIKPLPALELRKGLLKAMFDIASLQDTKDASRRRMYRVWKDAMEQMADRDSVEGEEEEWKGLQ